MSAGANGLSTAITVTATSRDAGKAARIANEVVHTYIGDQIAIKRSAAGNAASWLNQRISDLSEQLRQQQSAIAAYKAVHGLNDSAPGSSLVDQQMGGINAQIVLARSELAEKQAQSDRVQALMRTGNSADVAQVISSPLIIQLRTQQAELVRQEGELSTQYGPLHPKMKALQGEKADLDQKIAQEVSRLAGSIASDVSVARAHLNSLEASLKSVVQPTDGPEHVAGATGCAAGQCRFHPHPIRNLRRAPAPDPGSGYGGRGGQQGDFRRLAGDGALLAPAKPDRAGVGAAGTADRRDGGAAQRTLRLFCARAVIARAIGPAISGCVRKRAPSPIRFFPRPGWRQRRRCGMGRPSSPIFPIPFR